MRTLKVTAAACLLAAAAALTVGAQSQMSVTVKEAQVRANPSFLGPMVGVLAYGARVSVLAEQAGWMRVSIPGGREGWVHGSALTQKRIVLQAGSDVQRGASSGEVALAGKGFNQEVEDRYKEERSLDYTWVDRMEAIVVPPEQSVVFLKEGGLEGARP